MFMLKVIAFLTYIPAGTFAGCRWYNPAWLQNLNSAPQVDISTDQLVTVRWGKRQFKKKFECADNLKFGLRIMMRKGGCALSLNTMGKQNTKTHITYK